MYKAIVTRANNLREHPNADRLKILNILGTDVIVPNTVEHGQLGLYFEPNIQLSEEFCKYNNLYRDNTKNMNPDVSGFIENNRRVKAINLRGQRSEGMWLDLNCMNYITTDHGKFAESQEFDVFYGKKICTKYVVKTKTTKKGLGSNKYIDESVIPTFVKHVNTNHFIKELHNSRSNYIFDGSYIVVTEKLHGTSFRCGNLPIEDNRNWFQRNILRKKYKRYNFAVGSRNLIKTVGNKSRDTRSYHDFDIWTHACERFRSNLHKGETIYGEIVGYLPNGNPIMGTHSNKKLSGNIPKSEYKDFINKYGEETVFHYGCDEKKYELYVYRITNTTDDGITTDLPWELVKLRCEELNIKHVPELAKGVVYMYEERLDDGEPITKFELSTRQSPANLEKLIIDLTESDSEDFPLHIKEGVVVRIDVPNRTPKFLKHKAFNFKVLEGIAMDENETNLEDSQK